MDDPLDVAALRNAIAATLDQYFDGLERDAEWPLRIPCEAAEQARRAACIGIELDLLMRSCAAGGKQLEEFVLAEAEEVPWPVLCHILREQGTQMDHFMKCMAAEYADQRERIERSTRQTQAGRIRDLLVSDSIVKPVNIDYDFDIWHLGMILRGQDSYLLGRTAAERRGCRFLCIERDGETAWIWLGSPQRDVLRRSESQIVNDIPTSVSLAIGEPRKGLAGWRQTHREAQLALQVLLYMPKQVARCRDVLLIAAAIQDRSLAVSLIETYLKPLDGRGDSGAVLRETIRAYFEKDQNTASAAAALGVARQTVERRLKGVERRLGERIDSCRPQLQVALCVEEILSSD